MPGNKNSKSKKCFVIMPFSATTEKHTAEYWTNFFENFIKPTVTKLGYDCIRSSATPVNLVKDIIKELSEADLVLAVLTDFNPNVWYELGIRHSIKKGTIMIIEEGQRLPFDISHYGVIKYQDSVIGFKKFERDLYKFIKRIDSEHPIDSPVIEFLEQTYQDTLKQELEESHKKLEESSKLIEKLLTLNQKFTTTQRIQDATKRVLWVDDYPSNNTMIMELFTEKGVLFDIAVNTRQALKKLYLNDYDLIISDIGRDSEGPDAGVHMIKVIKEKILNPPLIIIFSSQKSINKYGYSAWKYGAILVTSSPYELISKMAEILEVEI